MMFGKHSILDVIDDQRYKQQNRLLIHCKKSCGSRTQCSSVPLFCVFGGKRCVTSQFNIIKSAISSIQRPIEVSWYPTKDIILTEDCCRCCCLFPLQEYSEWKKESLDTSLPGVYIGLMDRLHSFSRAVVDSTKEVSEKLMSSYMDKIKETCKNGALLTSETRIIYTL